ncbi:hypothetical protein BgiMline_032415, partial [Biomphalaria glabrata]
MKISIVVLSLVALYAWSQSPEDMHAYMGCIIETKLSNEACKAYARSHGPSSPDPAQACSGLQAAKASFLSAGCTVADYNILHAIVCEHQHIQCVPPPQVG